MAGVAEDEIVEHTLTQIPECYVFHLPPRVRAQGWLAADMTKQMWTGRMRVVQRGLEAAVMLIDRRDGKLFAVCKVEDGAVERVPDSSRYFVIKIMNAQGQHAFVGLAFDDRNQAFDFNVALQEFKKDVERSKMLAEGKLTGEQRDDDGEIGAPSSAASNFSLKQGDKIKIGLRGKSSTSRPRRKSGLGGTGSGTFTLAPPPGDTARRKSATAGLGGLLAPPPGDTRRARATPISRPVTSIPLPALAPGAPVVPPATAPSTHDIMMGFQSAMSSGSRALEQGAGTSGVLLRGANGLGEEVGVSSGIIGGGSASPFGQGASTPQDDDPLGLGLGGCMTPAGPSQAVAFSPATVNDPFASPNLPPPPSGPAWGLSGLSELSAGLPSTGPPSSGGMSSGGLQQRVQGSQGSVLGPGAQQQAGGYAQDPFNPLQPQAYPHDGGWGPNPGMLPTRPSLVPGDNGAAAAARSSAAASDNPLGGLF